MLKQERERDTHTHKNRQTLRKKDTASIYILNNKTYIINKLLSF